MRNNLPLHIDEDDEETTFDDTNEVSGRNDRFLYARMLNTIPVMKEKSNLQKYTLVAIILSLFFMSIILFTFFEEITTVKLYNRSEDINTTKIYDESKNETVTENIMKEDKLNTSIIDNIPINNNTTEIIFTEKKLNHTENNIEIMKDNFLITNEQLNSTKNCLAKDISSVEDLETIKDIRKCTINPGPILTKTKIRFIMGNSLLFICLVHAQTCNYLYEIETNTHIVQHGLKDIYFNYVLGSNGEMYEGRSLNCLFDENILSEDHSTVLIVGMPNCAFLDNVKDWEKQTFFNMLKLLLNCLENNGILNSNYTMEFDMTCKNFLIAENFFSWYNDKIILIGDDSLHIEKYLKH